jgi:hypothetical protein
MKKYTEKELREIIENHAKWLRNEDGGIRADLSSADLSYANLSSANLSYANLSSADLSYANLSSANLSSADLSSADLSYANLSSANLSSADLSYANLSSANLRSANLSSADLSYANLLDEIIISYTSILPEGDLIGWKLCTNNVIVKLKIHEESKRSNSTGRKCRAEFVEVLEVFNGEIGISMHDRKTKYTKGEFITCDKFDLNRWEECSGGIHFFITRLEAENYN